MRPRVVYRHRRTGKPVGEAVVVSVHEAGHAVVALALGVPMSRAALEEDPGDGWFEHQYDPDLAFLTSWVNLARAAREHGGGCVARPPRMTAARRELVRRILIVSAAGHAAESRLLGGAASQRWGDRYLDRADVLAAAALLPTHERRRVIAACRVEARRQVEEHWPRIDAAARRLRQRESVRRYRPLSGLELLEMMGPEFRLGARVRRPLHVGLP